MANHSHNPLDFLYEEIPPEQMADARAHLAECDQCREETAAIRDIVKTYREAAQPTPPSGFAHSVAAKALEAAAAEKTGTAALAIPAPADELAGDEDFEKIKQDVLAGSRFGWRGWLFHPAWTVAASVLLICTVLIYVSPRRDEMFPSQPKSEANAPEQRRQIRMQDAAPRAARQRIPAPEQRQAVPAFAPPPPAPLREAEEYETHAAESILESLPAPAAPSPSPAPVPVPVEELPREAVSDTPVIVDMMGGVEPPQLIARPTPIDTVKLTRDLAFLAGLQIGHNEFDEAWITIGMLRKYDAEKANELANVVREMESAAAKQTDETATPAEAEEEPEVDKYFRPETTEPEPEPATPVVPEEPTAPEPVAEPIEEPQPEPATLVEPELVTEPVTEIDVEIPESIIPEPEVATTTSLVIEEAISPTAVPSVPAFAPDVPKDGPDAFPPTLGESRGLDTQRVGAPKLLRSRQPQRGLFTTDPYWRRD